VTGEVLEFDQPRSQAQLDHSRHHQKPDAHDADPRDAEDEADPDGCIDFCGCGRNSVGEGCKACGDPLWPMHQSVKGGLSNNPCPTEAYRLPAEDEVNEATRRPREVKTDRLQLADEGKPPALVSIMNGSVKRNGHAVMGKGCALEAVRGWPMLPMRLGEGLRTNMLQDEVFDRAYLKQKG
jgi:hypothetical protein